MIYLISYEINRRIDHTALFEAIKSYKKWWHYLDSTWMVKTDESAKDIAARLHPFIDNVDDSLLVIKVDPSSKQGWLPQKAWDWIKRNA